MLAVVVPAVMRCAEQDLIHFLIVQQPGSFVGVSSFNWMESASSGASERFVRRQRGSSAVMSDEVFLFFLPLPRFNSACPPPPP